MVNVLIALKVHVHMSAHMTSFLKILNVKIAQILVQGVASDQQTVVTVYNNTVAHVPCLIFVMIAF